MKYRIFYIYLSNLGIGVTMTSRDQVRKGSTEILIFSLHVDHPIVGYQISQQLKQGGGGYFGMKEGLLYPAFFRLLFSRKGGYP